MTDKIQKIREGIEKLKSNLIHGACASQVVMETRCKEEAYNEVLAILDIMQEEPTSWLEEFKAKVDSMSKEDFKKIFDKYAIDFEEELVSDDLEEVANNALNNVLNAHEIVNVRSCLEMFKYGAKWQREKDSIVSEELEEATKEYSGKSSHPLNNAFKAGANWQKKQDQSTIELAEDHAMFAGMEKMKEEMMEKAVDAELYSDGMLTPLIGVNDKEVVKDIKFGDKIKLIIIKDKKDI